MSRPPSPSGYLPGQSSVLADLLSRRDQVLGTVWPFHLPVAAALLLAWDFPSFDLFMTGFPAVLPLFCSLVPNHRVVFLDAFRVHWAALGLYAFRPSFCRMGGGSSRRDHSLLSSGSPPLTGVGVVRGLSPPFLGVLPVLFHRGKVCQSPVSGSQSALNLSWPRRTWFARSIVDLSMFLINFSVPVGSTELRSPPGVVTLFTQGLTRDLCVPFSLRLGVSLPGHRSSS